MKGWRKGVFGCFLVALCFLLTSGMAGADVFCVSNETELQEALSDAATNGYDDIIRIIQGTYYGSFSYLSDEANDLTIEGGYTDCDGSRLADPNNTIIDAVESGGVLRLIGSDNPVNFIVDGLTLQNGAGGGLYVSSRDGTLNLTNNRILSNSTGGYGGGVHINDTDEITIVNNLIADNYAYSGGGIKIEESCRTIRIENNTISNNTGSYAGGVSLVGVDADTISFVSNTFADNSTIDQDGGAVELAQVTGTMSFLNNTIVGNTSLKHGGGVYIYGHGTVNLINNTFVGNSSGINNGGGIYLLCFLGCDGNLANIYNNIFWGNTGARGNDLYLGYGSNVNLFHNDFDQSSEGIEFPPVPIDPSNLDKADPLFVDPGNQDYHLQPDSPCVDTGHNDAPELPATDKDGQPRIVNEIVDMGAYEYGPPVADFSAFPLRAVTQEEVSFSDESTGTIDSWLWDFGDGNTTEDQNPTHTYEYPDIYSVSLTVSGPVGWDSETKNDYITVVSSDAADLSGGCREFHSYEFGKRIVVKVQVVNRGNEKTGSFKVAFYLSSSTVPVQETIVRKGLRLNQTKDVVFKHESETPLSGQYIRAEIDPYNVVPELDELNNSMAISIP